MKYIDDNGIWWHLNDGNDDLYKLLINPDTSRPYRRGELIKQEHVIFMVIQIAEVHKIII